NKMGLDADHIYIGIKSARAEIYKMHKWIKANENILMNLRLQAWYAKGFSKWYVQDSNVHNSNLIDKYFDLTTIKTRPLDRKNRDGSPFYEQDSKINGIAIDSGFYDITLLKDAREDALANVIYMGVQNRRTDPLILNNNNQIEFIPSAEFDSLVQYGGNAHDSTYWQSKWWQRFGAREIRIPINCDPNYVGGYYIFARELGAKDTAFRNQNFWLNNRYHHWIDTVIKPGELLISKHLPGEGKLIKMEINNLAEGYPQDTCTGCYWAKRHLQIETSPMEDSCWTITITNTSSCDYESLQLLMQEVSNDFEGFRIENDNFKTVIYGHNHYFYKNTSLKSGQTYIIQMCGDPNKYYSYKFMLGTFILDSQIVDEYVLYSRQLIVCDSLSDIFTSGPCCENINIVRTNWVWRMAPDCQISYQPLNKMIYIHHSLG
ncbi:MAG TPA: hypothetical protein P5216_06760, partial [Bacteroidota bacterium]|nr:hypothetical protein [Bacteroidota bacterium]